MAPAVRSHRSTWSRGLRRQRLAPSTEMRHVECSPALVVEMLSRSEAAGQCGMTDRRWGLMHRYNAECLSGLCYRSPPVAEPHLSADQDAEVDGSCEMRRRRRCTAWCVGGGSICRAWSRSALACASPSAALVRCCAGSASTVCLRRRANPGDDTAAHAAHKKFGRRSDPGACSWQTDSAVVARRAGNWQQGS